MTRMPAPNESKPLHHVGAQVADALDLEPHDLSKLDPTPTLPTWQSNLRVAELAYDSAALASLAMYLVSKDREISPQLEQRIMPNASRLQASFGSEKLFRFDGRTPTIWASLSGFWRVSDGWVRTHGNYPHHAERLAKLLGLSPEADRATVEAKMLHWTRFALEAQAAEVGALAIAVRDQSEWRHHPQYPALEQSPVIHFEARGQAPPRSWHNTNKHPLSGVRVLDLTRVIAGPVATRDLAIVGADVLRIDSPRLPEPAWQHLDTGHEKRSTLLDFDDPADFAMLQQLLAGADVVVHGYRPTALAKYGLDFETLHRQFPGIIVAQLSAWGTRGTWGDRRGFDSLVQAASGIAVLESKDGGETPGALPVQALDHSAGHLLVAAIATALRRQRTGGGSYDIQMSLAKIAGELLAAGLADNWVDQPAPQDLPTVQVPVNSPTRDTHLVTCAPPLLDYPGAPTNYRSPLHEWGTDEPRWIAH
ncbi:CoA transferase [Leucobacter denitrificans]|uniref:CoA transferase n=1 Tax=Leucobacter denitrificans TaxID=683042 RepID=A0A7G9S489_9MICO|nr:CoA transferase [Leucobacter denitrificans]QNN62664.1 CoA transferase [Leucobacter denitrificans]